MTAGATFDLKSAGRAMHDLMARLFPLPRSLTGPGVRDTLAILGESIPLTIHEVPSGTRCFDWTVPDEWTIRDAWVKAPSGRKVIDFKANTLHVMGYSEPINAEIPLETLREHLHTRPDLPDAIPYVTSYYQRRWGFCMAHRDYERLEPGTYSVHIDSTLEPGSLSLGEILIPGDCEREVLLSTNICHPSMANNELSGPVLATFLARWLLDRRDRRLSYRIVFAPETIGAIAYLSRNAQDMRRKVLAGYQVVCVGGPGGFTYLKSRDDETLANRAALHVLQHQPEPYRVVEFPRCASDERQYNSPGIDLPVGVLMRAKFHDYPQYHTSLDDLEFVTPEHMQASFDLYRQCLLAVEANRVYANTVEGCEPQMGRRNLHPTLGGGNQHALDARAMLVMMMYTDGTRDLLEIARRMGQPVTRLDELAAILFREGLLEDRGPRA